MFEAFGAFNIDSCNNRLIQHYCQGFQKGSREGLQTGRKCPAAPPFLQLVVQSACPDHAISYQASGVRINICIPYEPMKAESVSPPTEVGSSSPRRSKYLRCGERTRTLQSLAEAHLYEKGLRGFRLKIPSLHQPRYQTNPLPELFPFASLAFL
jgi:hypothetical protein